MRSSNGAQNDRLCNVLCDFFLIYIFLQQSRVFLGTDGGRRVCFGGVRVQWRRVVSALHVIERMRHRRPDRLGPRAGILRGLAYRVRAR